MEVTGLVVGVAGLAGLLEACIAVFDRVDQYRQYGSTSRHLQTRFENQKFLLEQWRVRAGITVHESPLETRMTELTLEDRRKEHVVDTLECIRESLQAITEYFQRNPNASSAALKLPLRGKTKRHGGGAGKAKPSPWMRVKWAVGDKDRLTEQVEWFETMVQALHDLVPPLSSREPSRLLANESSSGMWPLQLVPQAVSVAH